MRNCKNGLLSKEQSASCEFEWESDNSSQNSNMNSSAIIRDSDLQVPQRDSTGKQLEIKLELVGRPILPQKKTVKATPHTSTGVRPTLQNSSMAPLMPTGLLVADRKNGDHALKERGHRIIDKMLTASILAKEKIKDIFLDRKANSGRRNPPQRSRTHVGKGENGRAAERIEQMQQSPSL